MFRTMFYMVKGLWTPVQLLPQHCTEGFLCAVALKIPLKDPTLFQYGTQNEVYKDIIWQGLSGKSQVACTEPCPPPH